MIGKFIIGKSFRGCLLYCLNDKQQKQGEEQPMKDRSEVLLFNQCYGNQKELIQQFQEVRQLNMKLAKPVLHITLSFSPGEKLEKEALMKMVSDCAHDFGFEKNQYIAIAHNDTGHRHIHIIANRIGFDKKTVSDSNSYKMMAAYCRKMELKHDLKQVLSPRQFLPKELRNIPRIDTRKEAIKNDIREALLSSKNYDEFEALMKQKKYEVIRGRGIAFIDSKKIYVKGSEIGYSLATIEKILAQTFTQKQEFLYRQSIQEKLQREPFSQKIKNQSKNPSHEFKQGFSKALEILMKVDENYQQTPHELLQKKRKRKRQSQHL